MSSSGAAADDEAINIGDDGVDEFEAFFGKILLHPRSID